MNINGSLEQDLYKEKDNIVSILNAPSPAATSSMLLDYLIEYLNL